MEMIRDAIEWIATDTFGFLVAIFPYLMVGLVGLYLLWVLLGYLRVSQVGLADRQPAGQVVALPGPSAETPAPTLPTPPRGVPYCAFDGLEYPRGARFCLSCERDLSLDCVNCGATLTAGDASCYRCGTRTGSVDLLDG